jgi:hypothetical protein
LVSILGDDRSGRNRVELVAEADLRAVFGEVVLQVSASPTEGRPGVEVGGINLISRNFESRGWKRQPL